MSERMYIYFAIFTSNMLHEYPMSFPAHGRETGSDVRLTCKLERGYIAWLAI